MLNLHTGRFSKLKAQVEAMRQDRNPDLQKQGDTGAPPGEPESFDGVEPTLSSTVATLQTQLAALRTKLQQVESELWGEPLKTRAADGYSLRPRDTAGDESQQRQRGLEAQVRQTRSTRPKPTAGLELSLVSGASAQG